MTVLVAERLPAKDAALPVRRAAVGGAERHLGRLAHGREVASDARRVGDKVVILDLESVPAVDATGIAHLGKVARCLARRRSCGAWRRAANGARDVRSPAIAADLTGVNGQRFVEGQEDRRYSAAGWTYEPPTFYEANPAAAALVRAARPAAAPCRAVAPVPA